MRFQDKIVIITGAASGIGLAASRLFAGEGAIVAVCDIKAEQVISTVAEVCDAGGRAVPLIGDITDTTFAWESVKSIVSKFGQIDILLNNAGIATSQPAEAYTAWRRVHAVNVDAPFNWSQLVANESMIHRKQGAIVNVASLAGLNAYPGDVGYIASKHGVVGLTKALAVEWIRYGIRVNCLCPDSRIRRSSRTWKPLIPPASSIVAPAFRWVALAPPKSRPRPWHFWRPTTRPT
jgi:NAD(P)-dependent dehydrogenase (short-subunit alcohol dehydrogenase family)